MDTDRIIHATCGENAFATQTSASITLTCGQCRVSETANGGDLGLILTTGRWVKMSPGRNGDNQPDIDADAADLS